jgi:hypothetical protein
MNLELIRSELGLNQKLTRSELKLIYKLIKNELKLNKKLIQVYYKSWMNIQMNEPHDISIRDNPCPPM